MKSVIQDIETLLQELRTSEVRYRRLFEAAQDGILILDADSGKISAANPFVLNLLGYTLEQLLGKQLWEIGFFRDRELAGAAFEKLQREGYIRYEDLPLESRDGGRHDVEFVSNLYVEGSHRVIQCNIRDITARKLLEAKLRQAQKMEAIGQLAGGVAHDYNNILTSTLLQLSLLLEDPDLSADTRGTIQRLETEAKQAASLTRQLLLFSRKQFIQLKALDLNAVLTDLVAMLRRLLSKDTRLEFQAGPVPLWIEADAIMIKQVVTNLCLNAQDAMAPLGGQITIDARHVEQNAELTSEHADAPAGSFVCVSVIDSGCGMDPATLEHLFEPFFTTKGVGQGTGLGLSTVYGITKQHRGWVKVTSQLGQGSAFRIYLPALPTTPAVAAEPVLPPEILKGPETVLLVDDEPGIRDTVARGLRRCGYRVLAAENCQEAIRVWADQAAAIDILFTDMKMPGGMNGVDLFKQLKQSKRSLKGIISSGYSDKILEVSELARLGADFLPKPYGVATLASAVRKCLDKTIPASQGAPPT